MTHLTDVTPPAPSGRLFEMANRLSKGKLWSDILRMRGEGVSIERISKEVFHSHGVDISKQTISTWLRDADRAAS
jgi:intein-encoded DNA endonuclease-like protein